jgi:hypothetical protein
VTSGGVVDLPRCCPRPNAVETSSSVVDTVSQKVANLLPGDRRDLTIPNVVTSGL